MSLLDPREKTISLKVVYYGPGLGGKTTSLKYIHKVIDPEGRVKLVSLDTDEDRTLFFDFLPIELGLVGSFKVKIQGFTVPGQVKYNMTRRYVLTGADGIVFVADSDPARLVENVESLINLGDNLRAHGLNVNNIPLVFEYNKQDLNNSISPAELEEKLNFRKVPGYATVATRGDGIFEAFMAVSKLMVSRVIKTYNLKEEQADEERILKEVETRLLSLRKSGGAGAEPQQPLQPAMADVAIQSAPSQEAPSGRQESGSAAQLDAQPQGDSTSREADDFFGTFTGSAPSPDPKPQQGATLPRARVAEGGPVAGEPLAVRTPARHPGNEKTAHAEASSGASENRPTAVEAKEIRGDIGSAEDSRTKSLLRDLLEIGRGLASGSSLEKSATKILSTACQALDATGGSLMFVDESEAKLEARFKSGFRNDPLLLSMSDEGQRLVELLA